MSIPGGTSAEAWGPTGGDAALAPEEDFVPPQPGTSTANLPDSPVPTLRGEPLYRGSQGTRQSPRQPEEHGTAKPPEPEETKEAESPLPQGIKRRRAASRRWLSRALGHKVTGGADFDTARAPDDHVSPDDRANPDVTTVAGLSAAHTAALARERNAGSYPTVSPITPGRGYEEPFLETNLTRGAKPAREKPLGDRHPHARATARRASDATRHLGSAVAGHAKPLARKTGRGYISYLREYVTRDDAAVFANGNPNTLGGKLGIQLELWGVRGFNAMHYLGATAVSGAAGLDLLIPGQDSLPRWDSSFNVPGILFGTGTALHALYVHRKNAPRPQQAEDPND